MNQISYTGYFIQQQQNIQSFQETILHKQTILHKRSHFRSQPSLNKFEKTEIKVSVLSKHSAMKLEIKNRRKLKNSKIYGK